MPYVKTNVRDVKTGEMREEHYLDENDQQAIYRYPETKEVWDLTWATPWQPEHAPVGSVVRYNVYEDPSKEQEVTVTGHYWNGIQSWVILTNDPCPILRGNNKSSFNGTHLTSIVSRGTGGVQFTNYKGIVHSAKEAHKQQQEWLLPCKKKPHEYAAGSPAMIIQYVLSTHPKFCDYLTGMHLNAHATDIAQVLLPMFKIDKSVRWFPLTTVNKKKLIKALERVIPRMRRNKTAAAKAAYLDEMAFYHQEND